MVVGTTILGYPHVNLVPGVPLVRSRSSTWEVQSMGRCLFEPTFFGGLGGNYRYNTPALLSQNWVNIFFRKLLPGQL